MKAADALEQSIQYIPKTLPDEGKRDAEWAELVSLLPPLRRLGRPRKWELREIVDALLYIGWSGCQ
jgi:hypothetical protein